MSTRRKRTIEIAPGYLVLDVSESSGGVRYDREVLVEGAGRGGRVVEALSVQRVDNERIVKDISAAIKDVDHVLRTRCVRTPFGHFATEAVLPDVLDKVDQIRARVEELNAEAIRARSAHRGRVGVVTAYLDLARDENVTACLALVHGLLVELYDVLRAGDVEDTVGLSGKIERRQRLRPVLLRAKNMETLVVGRAAVEVRAALAEVKTAKAAIVAAIRAKTPPEVAGAEVSLGALRTAIDLFEAAL
jgi:hypothetical protein